MQTAILILLKKPMEATWERWRLAGGVRSSGRGKHAGETPALPAGAIMRIAVMQRSNPGATGQRPALSRCRLSLMKQIALRTLVLAQPKPSAHRQAFSL